MNTIDVAKLSKKEVKQVLQDMINGKIVTIQLLEELCLAENKKDKNRISEIVDRHFEEYDEVFRKLA